VIPALHRATASAGSSTAIIMMAAFYEIDEHDNPGAIISVAARHKLPPDCPNPQT